MQDDLTQHERAHFKLSLLAKILIVVIAAGLIPLFIIGGVAIRKYNEGAQATKDNADIYLDELVIDMLLVQSEYIAQSIEDQLNGTVQDILRLAGQPIDYEQLTIFYTHQKRPIHFPSQTGTLVQKEIPIYRELAYIDNEGNELFKIRDDVVYQDPAELKNVSLPENTTYLTEDYFAQIKKLEAGEVYVSPVTAWHASLEAQPGNILDRGVIDGTEFADYEAVIRFGTPVFDPDTGVAAGMLLLSLDHRHIIEKSNHVLPGEPDFVVWPDYQSGNYAFLVDHEAYIIGHPILERMRGLDPAGEIVPPIVAGLSEEEKLYRTFNFIEAGSLGRGSEELPNIYRDLLAGVSSYKSSINLAGVHKFNAYVPIQFEHGVYADTGIFGGVIVGKNIGLVHEKAEALNATLVKKVDEFKISMILSVITIFVFIGLVGFAISKTIYEPMRQLMVVAKAMQEGVLKRTLLEDIYTRPVRDEVSSLAFLFLKMGEKIKLREDHLRDLVHSLKGEVDDMKTMQVVNGSENGDFLDRLEQEAAIVRRRKQRRRREKTAL